MILSDIPQHREALGANAKKVSFFPVDGEDQIVELMKQEVSKGKCREVYDISKISAQVMTNRYMEVYKRT